MADTSHALISAPTLESIREQLDPPAEAVTRTTLSLSLATPMFGGGVKPGEVDLSQPFRPSAIRGQLRFWWRATAGARFSKPDELFEAEARLWGDTRQSSRVRLRVKNFEAKVTHPGWGTERLRNGETRDVRREPAYIYFPIKPGESSENTLLINGRFDLDISIVAGRRFAQDTALTPAQIDEVMIAIKAWILFGGIGARTRRGCGSLAEDSNPEFTGKTALTAIRRALQDVSEPSNPKWPSLKGATLLYGTPVAGTPELVWIQLVQKYYQFRQKQRNRAEERRPGRSHWPEPDAIRRITKTHSQHHEPLPGSPKIFPRALLGLPILTEFRGGAPGDPPKSTLQTSGVDAKTGKPVHLGRHASPLIVKVVPWDKGTILPIALVLNTDIAERLDGRMELLINNRVIETNLSTGSNSPLDIRALPRPGVTGTPPTLRQWFRSGDLAMKEVIL